MKKGMNPQSVQVSLHPAREAIAREGGTVHVEVRVTPPAASPRADRRPVALALVIDRSGSMAGPASTVPQPGMASAQDTGFPDKLAFVKEASTRLLDLLEDGDLVSLVVFDDAVQVIKPMTRIDGKNRGRLADVVLGITTGGSTNIEGALREGYQQFTPAIRQEHSCKLVLMSDGEANVGEARPAVLAERSAGAAHNRVVTSTLGVGFDYNIALMAHLAEAGNGDFSHIEGLTDLDRQLREELAGAAEVTAANAIVDVRVPGGVSVGTNLNGYIQETETDGFKVSLGDLVRPKSFIFELSTPVKVAGDALVIGATVHAEDPTGLEIAAVTEVRIPVQSQVQLQTASIDVELVQRVLGMIRANAVGEASSLYDGGMADAATSGLRQGTLFLDRAEAAYGTIATDSADLRAARLQLGQMLNAVESGVLSAVDAKRAYIQASRTRKSRPADTQDRS